MYQVGMCQNELSGTGSIVRGWGTGEKTLWDEVDRGLEEATPLMGRLGKGLLGRRNSHGQGLSENHGRLPHSPPSSVGTTAS